jgi:hypothetical protein
MEPRELDQLVADQPGAAIHGLGEQSIQSGVRPGASDEEGSGLMQRMEPGFPREPGVSM